ncbi:MAG: hypothetical protein GX493_08315 [Firmicutes bacterium]|nr:hypothetical protein [Bacillota bacterium]
MQTVTDILRQKGEALLDGIAILLGADRPLRDLNVHGSNFVIIRPHYAFEELPEEKKRLQSRLRQQEMLQNGDPGLAVLVSVKRPDGKEFKLFPGRRRSMFTFFEDLKLVRLGPAESTRIRVRWEDPFVGEGIWHVLSREDWSEYRRSESYPVDEELLSTCFCLPGTYRLRFRVEMAPGEVPSIEGKRLPEDLWSGMLVSSEIRLKTYPRREETIKRGFR